MELVISWVVAIAISVAALWWVLQGLVGTWYLAKRFFRKRFWLNATVVVILMLIFGWNVLPILLAISIGLGWFTKWFAFHLQEADLQKQLGK